MIPLPAKQISLDSPFKVVSLKNLQKAVEENVVGFICVFSPNMRNLLDTKHKVNLLTYFLYVSEDMWIKTVQTVPLCRTIKWNCAPLHSTQNESVHFFWKQEFILYTICLQTWNKIVNTCRRLIRSPDGFIGHDQLRQKKFHASML